MRTDLTTSERESIARVITTLENEREALNGSPVSSLWGDLRDELAELAPQEG